MRSLLGVLLHLVARSAGRLGRTHDRTHDRGATATEYAILVGFVGVAIVLGVMTFGGDLSGVYQGFADAIGLN